VNQQAGAVSQWSGVFAAAAVATTVLLFAPYASYIPRASLAGLLILAAYRMVDGRHLLFHLRATRFDAGVVIATALAAVLISVEFCIVIGVFLSFVLYVPKAAQVRLTPLTATAEGEWREKLAGEPSDALLLGFELEGELFFGAEVELARHFTTVTESARGAVRAVVLVLKRGRNPDAGFLNLLRELDESLRARGAVLILSDVRPDLMRCLVVTRAFHAISANRIFPAAPVEQSGGSEALTFARKLITANPAEPVECGGAR
jgi:SulP family sulfate permease